MVEAVVQIIVSDQNVSSGFEGIVDDHGSQTPDRLSKPETVYFFSPFVSPNIMRATTLNTARNLSCPFMGRMRGVITS